MHCAQY
ncbi:23S rRNA (uracil-5-)-methyltransferase RumA, partial [Yersinia pestis PY-60]